ncbi:MAG: hypothetical protein ACPG77_12290, partial [Nannocystaceae bacterium]
AKRAGMRVSWDDLAHLSAEAQLPLVFSFFDGVPKLKALGSAATAGDYAMAAFMPAFVGKPNSFVLGKKGSDESIANLNLGKVYAQNAGLDYDKDGTITVGDIRRGIDEAYIQPAQGRAAIPVPLAVEGGGSQQQPSPSDGTQPSEGSLDRSLAQQPAACTREQPTACASSSAEPNPRPFQSYDLVRMPELHIGHKGLPVFILQTLLDWRATPTPLLRDGAFGPLTRLSLLEYQYRYNIGDELGVCSDGTWRSFGVMA